MNRHTNKQSFVLGLQLRPEHHERYLQVRRRMLRRIRRQPMTTPPAEDEDHRADWFTIVPTRCRTAASAG